MKFLYIFVAIIICGCSISPINKTPNTRPERSIGVMVEEKVARELPKALNSIIGQNVIDYGPYGIMGLLAILLGKKHIELKKRG